MKIIAYLVTLLLITGCFACGGDDEGRINDAVETDWLIPSAQVMDGGPGKDGIPSIDNPKFTSTQNVDYLEDTDLVIGMFNGGAVVAYPHPVLDWHEIVNDELGDMSYALTYCPLTGTANAWDRSLSAGSSTFGVSGKLYNNNLMPYDRSTDSYWSQLTMSCVNGDLLGEKINTFPIVETTWKTWKRMFPVSIVLNEDTGFDRDYDRYPYGDYKTNNNRIIFPLSIDDKRLPRKERVLGLIEDYGKKVYSLELFENPKAIHDVIGEKDLLILGSKEDNLILSFENIGLVDFEIDFSNFPIIGRDANDNVLDVKGFVRSGPFAGEQLDQPNAFMGYWFSFGAFHDGIEIYEN